MSNLIFWEINKTNIMNLTPAELARRVVIQKLRVLIPVSTKYCVLEQDTLSTQLSIGFYPGRLHRMSAKAYDNTDKFHFEDAFLPMLCLHICLFYALKKLWYCLCISNVADTKTEHLTLNMKTKVLKTAL